MDLSTILAHNPILTGGAALGLAGTMIASLRNVPIQLWSFGQRKFIYSLEFEGEMLRVLKDEILPKHSKNHNFLTAALGVENNESKINTVSGVAYTIENFATATTTKYCIDYTFAPGNHFIWLNQMPVWLTRTKEKKDNSSEFTERLYVSTLVAFKKKLDNFLNKEIVAPLNSLRDKHNVNIWSAEYSWLFHQSIPKRSLDSIILEENIKNNIVNDLQEFIKSEKWYFDRGIPYHRGYLLYGPPGNGKSSLIQTIAGYFNYDIYVINLAANGLNDSKLMAALSRITEGILLIEDIDGQFDGRVNTNTDTQTSKLTFSGILNALDGVGAKNGRVTFVTTNHIEKIDAALLRPGRLDYKLFLDNSSEWQATEIFKKFFPGSKLAEDFGKKTKGINMAFLQNHLLMHRSNDAAAYGTFHANQVSTFMETFKDTSKKVLPAMDLNVPSLP
jgi:chaperone BCS1